jgi:PilZ domain
MELNRSFADCALSPRAQAAILSISNKARLSSRVPGTGDDRAACTMFSEKRKHIRRALRYTAWVGLGEGFPLRGCMVFDVSETGARLEIEKPQELPELFTLLLSGRGALFRHCRVVWRTENQVGVRFEKAGVRTRRANRQRKPEPADA